MRSTQNVAAHPQILSIFSGIGMLDWSVRFVFPKSRTICYIERETYAAAVLAARMEEQALDEAPIWSDLTTFDGNPWRGSVDILSASPPCQPYSLAGKRTGNTDKRSHGEDGRSGPLPHLFRIISECQPSLVFFENVSAWVRGGHFQTVGEELSRLGYAIQEPIFLTAQSVGASHKRERVFILALSPHARTAVDWRAAMAHPAGDGPGERPPAAPQGGSSNSGSVVSRELPWGPQGFRDDLADSSIARGGGVHARRGVCGEEAGHPDGTSAVMDDPTSPRCDDAGERPETVQQGGECVLSEGCGKLADAECGGRGGRSGAESRIGCSAGAPRGQGGQQTDQPSGCSSQMAHSECSGLQERGGQPGYDGEELAPLERCRNALGTPSLFAPGPADPRWGDIIRDYPWLAPAITKEEAESLVRLLGDVNAAPLDSCRSDQLRVVGNSVVSQCAALALRILLARAKLV